MFEKQPKPKGSAFWGDYFVLGTWFKVTFITFIVVVTVAISVFTYFYSKYARITDERLRTGVFNSASVIYAAPQQIAVGDSARLDGIVSVLQRAGYSESENGGIGWYRAKSDAIEIHPGPDAYQRDEVVIRIEQGRIAKIISLPGRTERTQYLLEPEIITNLFDRSREKRILVHFSDIPNVMVNALMAAEDKNFFRHRGFDPTAILRAIWVDLRGRRHSQGASTLTQQLARTLWLGPERGWRRKIPESLITMHLEQVLTKKQIFEDYANAIYLGHAGSFGIHGFAKASNLYLGKDLTKVTLADAALLAGMIQAPDSRNPFRNSDRAKVRRDLILKRMLKDRFISDQQYREAVLIPVQITTEHGESTDAPYFVDFVNEGLQSHFQDFDFQSGSFRIYTTLDMNLQRDAVESVEIGIKETDRLWRKRSPKYGTKEIPLTQVAVIALDAQTGEVKAFVGGRNYTASQLNHLEAKRQPGSSFKPFVYTAALNSGLSDKGPQLTAASTVEDEPTTFIFNGEPYEPADHDRSFAGTVTLRYALAHSLNVPAVKIAEMVGYDKVAHIAQVAGLNPGIKATPAIALGAYEVTPLEIARAYTIFANYGNLVQTSFIKAIHDQSGNSVFDSQPVVKRAIDPRVAYIVENMMEEVLRSGTGAGVHAHGFNLPAAGKTGTSRDAWFAGFTSRLICVVWVGFDDNRDVMLEGARSALPIWAEFMKRAHQHTEYKNVHEFKAPHGIVTEQIDAETGELATDRCPKVRTEVFIDGTEPLQTCKLHGVPNPVLSTDSR